MGCELNVFSLRTERRTNSRDEDCEKEIIPGKCRWSREVVDPCTLPAWVVLYRPDSGA